MKIDEAVSKLIERLRSVQWGMVLDGDRAEDDPAAKCVFVDMRPDEFEALLREAAAALEAAQAERDAMREALKDADNELDWLDEDVDTCDHSVGVCMCSYWSMRRKMKAALSKGNSND